MKAPAHIPIGTLQCVNCHTSSATSFTTYTMNHAAVKASRCDACHNGSFTSQGTSGAFAKPAGHVATGLDSISCHTQPASSFASWKGAGYAHAAGDINCSSCHNGSTATGMKAPPHIPIGTLQCVNCHTSSATSFNTSRLNHAAVKASRCDACHNGSFT